MIYLLLFTHPLVIIYSSDPCVIVISNLHANTWPHKMQVFSNVLMPCTPKYDDLHFIHPFPIIFLMVLFVVIVFSFEELIVVG